MSVYYRFSHEKSDSFRSMEMSLNTIRTSDLKVLVAEHAGLGKEYMKLFDLKVFDEEEKEALPDDKMLPIYSRVVIKRIPWKELKEIHHEAQRIMIEGEETEPVEEAKLTLPSEYICKLCKYPLINPVLIKCAGSCGASACRDCVKNYLEQNKSVAVKSCPSCGQRFRGSVPNKSLANMLATIEWEKFNYPVRSSEAKPSADTDDLAKQNGPDLAGEAQVGGSISGASMEPELEETKPSLECNAVVQDVSIESSSALHEESSQKDPLALKPTHQDSEANPTVSQVPSADQIPVVAQNPSEETISASIPTIGQSISTEANPPSAPITNFGEQCVDTSIPVPSVSNAAPPAYPSLPPQVLPPHNAPPLIANHPLPPHPAMHPPLLYMDPWNMQGHPYPGFVQDVAPHHFHPGYPGAPFPQSGPAHQYGYVMQPPNMANPGMYGPQFQPLVETIVPICGPYLTEEQQFQLAMSFPMLSEENFELIKQAQQSVKDIWALLPKSIRSSLLQETPETASQPEKKNKPFKKRKDYGSSQNNVNKSDGSSSANNTGNSHSKQPSLKKRPIS
ncbi:hypothetical protein OJ253_2076 [Cryptosporidium canis]|uniref:RING-type domain-containing protein n=1 Tax=Cryptosporidium canis TaxID=195482 RepID=A0A9D5DME1_9CRYT|nr:hypothetical protein OJ253_2076 [Cryptosporidium canis]